MGKTIAQFTMSVDGFIADAHDGVEQLFKWYTSGDTELHLPSLDRTFNVSAASAELLEREWSKFGAIVTGKRDFEVSKAWGGKPLLNLPTFIVTHEIPEEWSGDDSPFTFVTDGVESAVAQAIDAAGDKKVDIGGSTIVQQCLQLGLLDEIRIDLVPIVLGSGVRLFDNLESTHFELALLNTIEGTGVTHLHFCVVK